MTTTSKQQDDPEKSESFWSLRSVALIVLFLILPFVWYATSVAQQAALVAEIEAAGGEVAYSYQVDTPEVHWPVPDPPPPAPQWLIDLVGIHWFSRLRSVSFEKAANPMSDELCQRLCAYGHWRWVIVNSKIETPRTMDELRKISGNRAPTLVDVAP